MKVPWICSLALACAAALGLAAVPSTADRVEQKSQGRRPSLPALESFDGMGYGFEGPHGAANGRNPSDNSLAVGPDHIVEIVNSRLAVYTKKGKRFDATGRVLYGAAATNTIFAGFGGVCEARNNGDAVVRYDQLAGRWLIVMPIFTRIAPGEYAVPGLATVPGEPAAPGQMAVPGQAASPGPAMAPPVPPPVPPQPVRPAPTGPTVKPVSPPTGTFAMCYAVSTTSDPLGPYYRYVFERPLFPDYPRPAVWPDGYYVPTSTGDDVIQKHACVADRNRMLRGLPATEQCIVIDDVNFLNSADVDGAVPPPAGAPNIIVATGGAQLRKVFEDDGIFVWKLHVDWERPANTKITGPTKIRVAPYHYLCDGQLTNCVPQPGTERRLDAQGDKIMPRVVYRNIAGRESILASHSIATSSGGGGVRWYELRLKKGEPYLYQQGTYAPDGLYRWMAGIGMDRQGNIALGYSFGGTPNFPGQRFAARAADDPRGLLTFRESVLVDGQASQTNTFRWEDYATLAMDPTDDCTFWYVGDYLKAGAPGYTTRIGAFRVAGVR